MNLANSTGRSFARHLVPAILVLTSTKMAEAQLATDRHVRVNVPAGFETEQYLRALQLAGIAPLYPWSVRAFGVDELPRIAPVADSVHPWSARLRPVKRGIDAFVLAPRVQALYNTTLPYGNNDGPIWAGRGLTTDVQFGFGAVAGPVSLIIAPEMFRAQNQSFRLLPNGATGNHVFGKAGYWSIIDEPQRFGDGSYQRFDPGQSTLRIAEGPAAVGFSTANEFWGPAVFNPIILGNNAGGFPHAFAGTSHPLDLWLFKIHGRAIWGRLEQSDYSPVTSGQMSRFGTGVVAIVEPRGFSGLELGASRFYHEVWPNGGPKWDDIKLSFNLNEFAASRSNSEGIEQANQLASLFFRWSFPSAGFEAYGEFAREDYGGDIYDVLSEPDHDSAYLIGVQRALRFGKDRMAVVKGEILNSRLTRLSQVRAQTPFYVHAPVYQGHTELGQVLGAPGGFGGGGSNLALDFYLPTGRWSVALSRQMVDQTQIDGQSMFYGLTVERLWFGRYADVRASATQAVQLNRTPGTDVGNLNLQVATLLHW
jgi:hypothetical protein